MATAVHFDNSYARLPERFFVRQSPASVGAPALIRFNDSLAAEMGLSWNSAWAEKHVGVFAGNDLPEGACPVATVYAGHQFGNWNPQLGDGRALLLGEVVSPAGRRFDIQLKGSGPTPFSRGGDGRAPLGPVLREYIVSEAMHALGIPTSRSLAAVTTGEPVYRDEVLPGAVLTRVASSHIRVGTFEYHANRGDTEAVRLLADHVLARHYPDQVDRDNRYCALLRRVIERTAKLIALWQQVGFIHGVMNTDNMLISGETIDYGPCAFMDEWNPDKVFSSIDQGGRYAYRNQPGIAQWNLACLAQSLLPLLDDDETVALEAARAELDRFPALFYEQHSALMATKLGFAEANEVVDGLVRDLFAAMAEGGLDYTRTFSALTDLLEGLAPAPTGVPADWVSQWRDQLADEALGVERMRAANPVIIPRNHQIEAVIVAAVNGDLEPFNALTTALMSPFDRRWRDSEYALSPRPEEVVRRTFCGT